MIPYGRQSISEEDIQAVVDVLRSDFLTQGPTVPAFEKSVADYCGTQHAIAVNSATSALHLACLALDVGPQDVVWTSPITFAASANCALYCGATVDFVDIDPDTGNLSVERLAEKLRKAEAENKLPKVVIPVHLCGLSCDMAAIHALSRQYGFKIIEDASHAIGARYKGEPVGSCRYSDIVVFSFHPVKIITTGEGGMALTNDTEVAKKVRLLRSHGITRDAEDMTHEPDGPWYYQQVALGFNYRMTDIQAALGLSQMQRLDGFVERRHLLAERYDALLAGLPVVIPCHHEDSYSSLHLYVIRIRQDQGCRNRRQVFTYLQQHGIGVNVHYIPLYAHPYYQRMGFNPDDYPMANQYYEEAISLPLYPDMSEQQQDHVVDTLRMAITV
jgi:UDP-4-amino-4,6-dideoxy-N-acetyl-beta-L-altrosamine transaminase